MTRLTLLIATLVLVILFFVVPALAGNTAAQPILQNYHLLFANLV